MIKTYHKTIPIKAEQFDGSNDMVKKYHIYFDDPYVLQFRIETMQEWVWMAVGDWIATDVNGEHWPIVNDIFKKTYAELPVIPKAVSDWINECISIGWTRNFLDVCYRAPDPVDKWIDNNSNMFARAWLDGYQLEES